MKNRKFHFELRKLTVACDLCVRPDDGELVAAAKKLANAYGNLAAGKKSSAVCCECKGAGKLRLTVGRIASAIFVNRAHLNDVLNNKPNHGGRTRWKVARFLKRSFPAKAPELLAALGWDDKGNLKPLSDMQLSVPRGTRPELT